MGLKYRWQKAFPVVIVNDAKSKSLPVSVTIKVLDGSSEILPCGKPHQQAYKVEEESTGLCNLDETINIFRGQKFLHIQHNCNVQGKER